MRGQRFLTGIAGCAAALALTLTVMPGMDVHAASAYTVTFRPGNVGHFGFAADADSGKTVQEMAQGVADVLYADYEVQVTENGAIKVKVPAGTAVAAPAYVLPDEGYCVRTWGPEAGSAVTKNVDYVVDYGRLTDGVEYTVEYVDDQSGEAIAPSATAYANIGDEVTFSAPAVLTTSAAGTYALRGEAYSTLTLSWNASDNIVTFRYVYSYDAGTVTEETVREIPGDTVTTTETYTTVVEGEPAQAPGAVQLQADADNGGDQDAGDADQNAEEDNQELVEIEDEQTPLTDQSDEEEEQEVTIEEEEAPQAALENRNGVNAAVIVAVILGVAVVVLAVVWIMVRRKGAGSEDSL